MSSKPALIVCAALLAASLAGAAEQGFLLLSPRE
jgi:hypothetical protein